MRLLENMADFVSGIGSPVIDFIEKNFKWFILGSVIIGLFLLLKFFGLIPSNITGAL